MALAAAMIGSTLINSAPAEAGSAEANPHADQVMVCLRLGAHDDIGYYTIDANNQWGDWVWSPMDNFDIWDGDYRCGIVPDWWWIGKGSISFYDWNRNFLGNQWREFGYWVGPTTWKYFD